MSAENRDVNPELWDRAMSLEAERLRPETPPVDPWPLLIGTLHRLLTDPGLPDTETTEES
jgi:hypothetical protein